MVHDAAKLGVQASSTSYSFGKDMFLYLKDKAKYIEDLEDNLTELTAEMITVFSRKKQIDRNLKMMVSKEKSNEYLILTKQLELFREEYSKFINEYGKHCRNLQSEIPEELDVSTANSIIDALQERKPTILTRKFFKLAKLSKDVKKLRDRIPQVTDRIKPENLLHEKEPEQVQGKVVDIDIPSFSKYVDQVMSYLHEDETRTIGIVGPIGVGKTAVMEMLNNRLKYTRSLKPDTVIWIDYPKQVDEKDKIVETMQDVIIARLKLVNVGEAASKAHIISNALCNAKYVLLVDQVSSLVDLEKVGIHKSHMFGKVVVASSSNKYIKQLTDKYVQIETLSESDAFDLFEQVCGKIHDQRIKDIADKIIESCGGLPSVIKLVAWYSKGMRTEDEWNGVKQMLQSGTSKLLRLGGVGNAYQMVYDGLEESFMKKCLLFGTLFPNNYKIYKDYLVECWMAEGFLELSDDDSEELRRLRKARDRGATVLRELTDRYLLERCWDKYVKMPVYFRKVALEQLYPAAEKCKILVPENSRNLKDELWCETTRMSLICCNPKLPENPGSRNMSTLLLQRNQELTIGLRFFEHMENLQVLDLYKTKITALPSSVSRLVKLVSLYLNDCFHLEDLSHIEMFKSLEVLDVRGTSINVLPDEFGTMCKLRCLRFSFGRKACYKVSIGTQTAKLTIRPNVICSLKQLEELSIEIGCCNQDWSGIADRIADELASLENLTTLFIHFPSVCSLQRFVTRSISWKNLETNWERNTFRSFNFSIGCSGRQHAYGSNVSGILAERQLRFSVEEKIEEEISLAEEEIEEEISLADDQETSSVNDVLRQASAFELVGHSLVESLSEYDLINAGSLKVCIVGHCRNLRWIVDAPKMSKSAAGAILLCLEMLHLFELDLLESIWKGSVFPESLTRLRVLTLTGCPELTEILNLELAKVLSSLEHLKVEKCYKGRDLSPSSGC